MNIESSHKFTRIDDTAYGCIEGISLEQYQVGVMDGVIREQSTTESTKSRKIIVIGVVCTIKVVILCPLMI